MSTCMQTRNGDLVITDQVRSTKHARYLGTTTEKGVMRQRPGVSEETLMRTEETKACEHSKLSMVVAESAELGLEPA
jgi:hypothetical protein